MDGETITLTGCPQQYCGRDTFDFIRSAELTRKGLPPVAGGQLDQTNAFIATYGFWLGERAQYQGLFSGLEDG